MKGKFYVCIITKDYVINIITYRTQRVSLFPFKKDSGLTGI